MDFGLVKTLQGGDGLQLSREDTVAGSPLFIAPEQVVHSQPPDRRADIYSLGAVAYYLLTGNPPFTGETAMEVMIAHTALKDRAAYRQMTAFYIDPDGTVNVAALDEDLDFYRGRGLIKELQDRS